MTSGRQGGGGRSCIVASSSALAYTLLLILFISTPSLTSARQERFGNKAVPKAAVEDCLHSASSSDINRIFRTGGEGASVILCPYASVSIDPHGAPILFTAPLQSLYTLGFPEDHSRATITITHPRGHFSGELTTAIRADCDKCRGAVIRNVHVDGGAGDLGGVEGGDALIVVGGKEGEQEIRNVEAWNTRGFALVHASEGPRGSCSDVTIMDNSFHSSGVSPLDMQLNSELVRLRDGPPPHRGAERPGMWTDGISIACSQSTVAENTIRDVSGIGIAIRGAPGTQVTGNTIVARDRDMLVGIAIVGNPVFSSKAAHHGGVILRENRVHAASAMIRVGISTGAGIWATDQMIGDHAIPFGSEIVKNRLSSYTGYFAYAIAVSDAKGIVVIDNAVSASVWGFETNACYERPSFALPTPLIRDPRSAIGQLQPEFKDESFAFLLCVGPGTVSSSNEVSRHQINDAYMQVHGTRGERKSGNSKGPGDIPIGQGKPVVPPRTPGGNRGSRGNGGGSPLDVGTVGGRGGGMKQMRKRPGLGGSSNNGGKRDYGFDSSSRRASGVDVFTGTDEQGPGKIRSIEKESDRPTLKRGVLARGGAARIAKGGY